MMETYDSVLSEGMLADEWVCILEIAISTYNELAREQRNKTWKSEAKIGLYSLDYNHDNIIESRLVKERDNANH